MKQPKRMTLAQFLGILGALAISLLAAATAARAMDIERVVSPGGIEAWLVEEHSLPIIALRLAVHGGSHLDPAGKEGMATLMSGLLDEGAGDLDSTAFQARLEELAIDLGFDAGRDTLSGSLRTLSENRDTAFDLLRLALTEPRFDPEPVERIRRQVLVSQRQALEDPNTIAVRRLVEELLPGHAYARPSDGTPESLAAITPGDLKAHARAMIARDSLKIAVVGDITKGELAALLDRTFGALPETSALQDTADVTARAAGARRIVIDRPNPQSVVAFGHGGFERDDPDFIPAYVLNYVLGGGGFASILTEEVREKRGLAYSVYSYLYPLDHAALFLGGVATDNARVAESLSIIETELARVRDERLTAEQLDNAKTYLTGSYPLRFDTNAKIANQLVAIQLDDLGIDYVDRRNGLIEAVTLDDLKRVARRLLDPGNLVTVVVGEPEGLEPAG